MKTTVKVLKFLALFSFALAFILPLFHAHIPLELIALGLACWVGSELV